MRPPSVIVFDLGKVLLDFDYGIAARRLAAESDLSAPEIRALIDQSPLLHRFETGHLTESEFFTQLRDKTGFRGDLAKFRPLFVDIFTAIDPMVALHDQLRQQRPTYILSNTNSLAIGHIRARFDFFSRFTGHVYSYEHGSMKPDPYLYEVVEKQSSQSGTDILFLDDRLENVTAAARRGWRTIRHQTAVETVEAIREQGLL